MLSNLVAAVTPTSSIPAPSFDVEDTLWKDISSIYYSTASDSEITFRDDVASGHVASPMNKVRLFGDDTEGDVRVREPDFWVKWGERGAVEWRSDN